MLPQSISYQVLFVVGVISALVLVYNIFMSKHQFPCNCPKCQEDAIADATQAFPEIGQQEAGTPVFATFLYSILALFVIAGVVAVVARVSKRGYQRIRNRLPAGRRFDM